MLKTVSSITNALGALNYKGTWNASTNTPTLTSSVGAKGDYYVVSVAGSTNLNGEALWGVGDWAVFNGSVWQRVEGGDTINATTVSASTSVTTPIVQATSSAGGTLKNNSGTNQMQWGSGGGNNLSLEVATNINPANAAVNISPTGTGTVTINPATTSTMDNVQIGNNTPRIAKFLTATTVGDASGANTQFNINGVVNKAGRVGFQESGADKWLIGNGAASENGVFEVYSATTGTGVQLGRSATAWTAASDERIKDIIEPITDAANKVASLRAVIGKYKTDESGMRRAFLIAQDVQAVLPEAIDDINPDKLGVRYTEIIPLLVAAITELQAEILKLKGV
jgi:hypothetical protein